MFSFTGKLTLVTIVNSTNLKKPATTYYPYICGRTLGIFVNFGNKCVM